MTQEHYNNFIQHFQNLLTEAETKLARLEAKMTTIEEALKTDRENGLWVSYGDDLDRLGDLVRDHRLWLGKRDQCRQAISAAKCYGAQNVEE